MCGIAGQICFQNATPIEPIAAMVRRIEHRGPDDHGLVRTEDGQCVLGHARLSIIDLSPAGRQPMIDPDTGNMIVLNGEIYNFLELRKECKKAGYQFCSQTDTEVILALYRRFGVECLNHLRGMFAFALWDPSERRLFMARDRVGKKPLNYALTSKGIVFASEINALAHFSGLSREEDMEALELYLQFQYIPAPWTIYKSIRKLSPAHYATFDRNGLRIKRYWTVDYRRKVRLTEREALDGLEEKLTEAVRLRMIADVPLGALLSGGVDSSLVVAMMAKLSGVPVKTFSIGFQEQAFNELPYAQQAAEICGTAHHPEVVEGDVEGMLPLLAKHYGEPFADSSAVPSFFVCATTRRHVKVALNGDGGDELLGGYRRYLLSPAQQLLSRIPAHLLSVRRMVDLSCRLRSANTVPRRIVRKLLQKLFKVYAHPKLRFTLMYNSFWNDEERLHLLNRERSTKVILQWQDQWLKKAILHADGSIDRMLWLDNRTYLPDDLLVKMDIASMHCGLETRSPFLDHKVIEYCASLPIAFKVRGQVGKYLLKRLAERYFPKEFIHRRKMGFSIPLAEWLRGPLRPMLEDVLRDPITMSPLNQGVISNTLQEFLSHNLNHGARLWTLLMFGVWRRHMRSCRP